MFIVVLSENFQSAFAYFRGARFVGKGTFYQHRHAVAHHGRVRKRRMLRIAHNSHSVVGRRTEVGDSVQQSSVKVENNE
jgi:hypothetical protein